MKSKHLIQIDAEKCVGCGLCQKDCPAGNIVMENKKARVITQECILCGHCVAICPKAAVSMTGFDEPPEEIAGPVTLDPQTLLAAIKTRRSILLLYVWKESCHEKQFNKESCRES